MTDSEATGSLPYLMNNQKKKNTAQMAKAGIFWGKNSSIKVD